MIEELGLNYWKRQDTSVCKALRLALKLHPTSVVWCQNFFQVVKWFGREVDLSPPFVAEVKYV